MLFTSGPIGWNEADWGLTREDMQVYVFTGIRNGGLSRITISFADLRSDPIIFFAFCGKRKNIGLILFLHCLEAKDEGFSSFIGCFP